MHNLFKNKSQYSIKDEYIQYINSMKNSNMKTYIEQRIFGQMTWYDKKSKKYKILYNLLTILVIILNATIPIFSLIENNKNTFLFKIIVPIISSIITVITGILTLCKFKELWIEYRDSCETLKSLLHRYFTHVDIFSNKTDLEMNELLISQCEYIMTHEVNNWININKQKEQNQSTISS